MEELSDAVKESLQEASKSLTGFKRREFQARTTLRFFGGSVRKAESVLGWGRRTVRTGMGEYRTGIRCIDSFSNRGRGKTEELQPELADAIESIVNPYTQADPQFRSEVGYSRLTAKFVRQSLISTKGYCDEELPTENTVGNMLNRFGYSLKRVEKTKPQKKYRRPVKSLRMLEKPMNNLTEIKPL